MSANDKHWRIGFVTHFGVLTILEPSVSNVHMSVLRDKTNMRYQITSRRPESIYLATW